MQQHIERAGNVYVTTWAPHLAVPDKAVEVLNRTLQLIEPTLQKFPETELDYNFISNEIEGGGYHQHETVSNKHSISVHLGILLEAMPYIITHELGHCVQDRMRNPTEDPQFLADIFSLYILKPALLKESCERNKLPHFYERVKQEMFLGDDYGHEPFKELLEQARKDDEQTLVHLKSVCPWNLEGRLNEDGSFRHFVYRALKHIKIN